MKNGVLILLNGLLGVILLAIVMTIGGNMNRSVELQENMSGAVEGVVAETMDREECMYASEMVEECIAQMAVALDSDMGVEFRVYQADAEKGILSVCAVGDYQHLNGEQGDVAWERTVICEQNGEDETVDNCEVRFYENKEALLGEERCYKVFRIQPGSSIAEPGCPKKEGLVFAGWRDANDYIADFSQTITQDISYYAAWE